MELNASVLVQLPPGIVWAEISDFDHLEGRLHLRDIDITRAPEPSPPGKGTTWTGTFAFSGKTRPFRAEITTFSPEEAMTATLESAGVSGLGAIALQPAGGDATDVTFSLVLSGKTIAAKLFLKPLVLAQGTLEANLSKRLDHIARAMEQRHGGA